MESCGEVVPSDTPCEDIKCTSQECCEDTECGGSGGTRSCPINCKRISGDGTPCTYNTGDPDDIDDVFQGPCANDGESSVVCRTQSTGGSPCAEINFMGCQNYTTEDCWYPVGEAAVQACNNYYAGSSNNNNNNSNKRTCLKERDIWISVLNYCLELSSSWSSTSYDILYNFIKNLIKTFSTSDSGTQTRNGRVRSTFSTSDSEKIATAIINNLCNPTKGTDYYSSPDEIGSTEDDIVSLIQDMYERYQDNDLPDPGKPDFNGGGGSSPSPSPTPSGGGDDSNTTQIILWVVIGLLALGLVIGLIIYFMRRRNKTRGSSPAPKKSSPTNIPMVPSSSSYDGPAVAPSETLGVIEP